jgi:hypothetical protein
MTVTRFILIREKGADVALLVDKLTMSVSEVPAPTAETGAISLPAELKRFDGIEAAVAISDTPEVSARMYYRHDQMSATAN